MAAADEKLEKLKNKYKLLANKHRQYLMQKNNEKIRAEELREKNNKIIFLLSNKIIELTPDDDLLKNQEFINDILKNRKD